MAERRSSRTRKAIKYTGLDDLSDDDFADTTPPPPKKQKNNKPSKDSVSKSQRESKQAPIVDLNRQPKETKLKERKSVRDKMYDRDLEEALQLSLLETGGSQELTENQGEPPLLSPVTNHSHCVRDKAPPPLSPIKSDNIANTERNLPRSPLTSTAKISASLSVTDDGPMSVPRESSKPNSKLSLGTVMDDSIEILGEEGLDDVSRKSKPQVRQARKKPAIIDSDDDDGGGESYFKPEEPDTDDEDVSEESDSPGDSDGDSDYDFDEKPKKKKNETKKTNLKVPARGKSGQQANVKSAARPAEKTSPANKKSTARPQISTSSVPKSKGPGILPSCSSSSSKPSKKASCAPSAPPTVHRTPNTSLRAQWKPPERVSPGSSSSSSVSPSLKSPTSGLRLGLSRNQRVKPLHPSVKVT